MLSRKGIKQKLSSEQLVKNYELINSYVQNSQKAALELPNNDVWLSEVNVVELSVLSAKKWKKKNLILNLSIFLPGLEASILHSKN